MKTNFTHLTLVLLLTVSSASIVAAGSEPPASPEVAAALQPYLDSYKLAGFVGIIADKTGKVHYKNLHGHADVEAMIQCSGPDKWAARDLFLKTATQVFPK